VQVATLGNANPQIPTRKTKYFNGVHPAPKHIPDLVTILNDKDGSEPQSVSQGDPGNMRGSIAAVQPYNLQQKKFPTMPTDRG
jgi:hypothetical protein